MNHSLGIILPALAAAVIVGAGLGLRQGEATGLTADRIDWLAGRSVRVDRQLVTPAAGVSRQARPRRRRRSAACRPPPSSWTHSPATSRPRARDR
ncbi:MAG: hypothetical protein ACRD1K_12145 [Acidimicrobiales bacterium]